MNINEYLDGKIENLASNFAHPKKNMKYSFEQYISSILTSSKKT